MTNTKTISIKLNTFSKYRKILDSFLAGLFCLLGLLFTVYYISSGKIIEDIKQNFGINYIIQLQNEILNDEHLQQCMSINHNAS